MNAVEASGVVQAAAKPCAAKRSLTSGWSRTFFSSALSFAMTSFGVPAGASRLFQAIAS